MKANLLVLCPHLSTKHPLNPIKPWKEEIDLKRKNVY
jgi:hypothetical protein